MPSTYTLIASNVLGSSAASVTFSSIPGTYTDLVLRVSGRATNASIISNPYIQLNGVTTTLYSWTGITGDGASASSDRASSDTDFRPGYLNGDNATSSTFGSAEIYFPNYANASYNKTMGSTSASESNATTAYITGRAGLFRSTSAISSILFHSGSNWVAGSSFYLYGIKNS